MNTILMVTLKQMDEHFSCELCLQVSLIISFAVAVVAPGTDKFEMQQQRVFVFVKRRISQKDALKKDIAKEQLCNCQNIEAVGTQTFYFLDESTKELVAVLESESVEIFEQVSEKFLQEIQLKGVQKLQQIEEVAPVAKRSQNIEWNKELEVIQLWFHCKQRN
jgi:hypothetical protein